MRLHPPRTLCKTRKRDLPISATLMLKRYHIFHGLSTQKFPAMGKKRRRNRRAAKGIEKGARVC